MLFQVISIQASEHWTCEVGDRARACTACLDREVLGRDRDRALDHPD
jgi:hypothetical protein